MVKKLGYIFLILLVLGGLSAFYGYQAIWDDNVNDSKTQYTIHIPTESSFQDVVNLLDSKGIINNMSSFKQVAKLMKYDKDKVPSGKYDIHNNDSNRSLISRLRAGNQTPVEITFNNHRTIEETVGHVAHYLELDSTQLVQHVLNPDVLNSLGYTKETILTLFLPDTYQVYWNTSAEALLSKLKSEHEKYWNESRIAKAKKLNLNPQEIYTLASIVEKESQLASERPIIAGLYLNRLQRGIPLQADPTVVYAVGDFSIRRVLNKHLETNSPYNTYKNSGLPPGPIYLASKQSIDAVLNVKKHDYLFMCAKPGYNSEHAFAKTSAEHSRNANRYRAWLTKEGIRK